MGLRKQSLELIILAPVLVFLVLAGSGLYFLILTSVEEFADRSIRQSFQSMSDGVFSIADREVDRLNWSGRAGEEKATKIGQVLALFVRDFNQLLDANPDLRERIERIAEERLAEDH